MKWRLSSGLQNVPRHTTSEARWGRQVHAGICLPQLFSASPTCLGFSWHRPVLCFSSSPRQPREEAKKNGGKWKTVENAAQWEFFFFLRNAASRFLLMNSFSYSYSSPFIYLSCLLLPYFQSDSQRVSLSLIHHFDLSCLPTKSNRRATETVKNYAKSVMRRGMKDKCIGNQRKQQTSDGFFLGEDYNTQTVLGLVTKCLQSFSLCGYAFVCVCVYARGTWGRSESVDSGNRGKNEAGCFSRMHTHRHI